ncbi:sigma 54-interacting transcriptional regulator [Peribacillus frigoritolerans]|uniref:sigma-54 interaction domain-containing protein n=1 Tax=Peribacillus frigoritolerans TaxID=450367 RepID=UPI003F80F8F0
MNSTNAQMVDVFSSMHNGVIVVNKEGIILFINPSAKKLLNIENENWKRKNIKKLVPKTKLPEVLDEGVSSIGEKLVINGQQCMVNQTPLYRDGAQVGAVSVIQDITEVEQYRTLLEQMESIIEFSTDGIYVVDKEGKTLLVNSAYEEMTGFLRKELIGNHMKTLMNQGYIDQSVSLLVFEKKKRVSIIQKIGGEKDVIVTGNPVFNQSGDIEMVVTSVRDITLLNEMRRELEKAISFSKISNNRYKLEVYGSDQTIVFQSEPMKQIYEQVKQIAPYPTSILLTGPSGVGKEVIADIIHDLSDRKEKPFIKVNCGAIPEHLFESELFGYEKGSFTGASKEGKIGLLELADCGTVLFDEIGEMPLLLQVKLLRVLQEKKVQRLGSTKHRKIDIRILSATNQDLMKLVSEGKFREDLYYRLQVVEIRIPALLERQEDIEVLIDHLFAYFCNLYHIKKHISENTKELLINYHWPGNVRELKNVVENMIVSTPSTVIDPPHLPFHLYNQLDTRSVKTLKQRVEQFEKIIVKEAIEKNNSIREVAQQLGLDHSTIVKKMKKWGWT